MLRYGPSGYNCLHQDVYGDLTFPLQFLVMLNRPDVDFTGGESVLVEQRPRQQSRPIVLRPAQGQARSRLAQFLHSPGTHRRSWKSLPRGLTSQAYVAFLHVSGIQDMCPKYQTS